MYLLKFLQKEIDIVIMINEKIDKTLDFIDLDPKFLLSILRKYLIHIVILTSLISTVVYLFSFNLDGGIEGSSDHKIGLTYRVMY